MKSNCDKSNIHCGTVIASNCVDYVGNDLKSFDKSVNQCDQNMTDVIENIDKEIKNIKDGLDTKKLSKLCITTIDKTDTPILIINKLIAEICNLSKELKEVKDQYIELDIMSSIVDVNTDCLTSSSCSSDGTLRSVLTKLVSEVCFLKENVSNSSNSSNFYEP